MIFNLNIKNENELFDQLKIMSDTINYLQRRISYLENITEELKYLARCEGATFPEEINRRIEA